MNEKKMETIRTLMEDMSSEDEGTTVFLHADENPYQNVGTDEETNIHQVIGNELIFITAGEGYCCLCGDIRKILYTDNSFGTNIAVQLCMPCIESVFVKTDLSTDNEEEKRE